MKEAITQYVFLAVFAGVTATTAVYTQTPGAPQTVDVTAKKFEFEPRRIEVKAGQPVTLNLTSLDDEHGFECKDLGVKSVTYKKGTPRQVTFTPSKAGTFEFKCSHRCGSGHGGMKGEIVVAP